MRIIEIIYPLLVSVIVAAVITWFIGWGRHLCDKEKHWQHILGKFIIGLFFLIIVFGILSTLAMIDVRSLFPDGDGR